MQTVTRMYGLTRVTVHSPGGILNMTPEEREKWFDAQAEAGNPVVLAIVEAMEAIERSCATQEEQEGA